MFNYILMEQERTFLSNGSGYEIKLIVMRVLLFSLGVIDGDLPNYNKKKKVKALEFQKHCKKYGISKSEFQNAIDDLFKHNIIAKQTDLTDKQLYYLMS